MTDRSPSKHTAHPRSRGENGAWCGRRVFSMGSSPLTRGKLAPPSGRGHHGGLIPAHAGKTTRGRGQSRSGSAHPRSRGENFGPSFEGCSRTGSSPLTRGKRSGQWPGLSAPRLIPAHAGKTDGGIQTAVARKAHPRSRGENAGAGAGIAAMSGSSPLTRGKPSRSQRNAGQIRLIPAHAGKTRPEHPRTARTGAHPRSRGENGPAAGMVPRVVGSSPLTRGKQTNAALAGPPGRLIPAHAGKTWSYVTGPDNLWAHPRSRGENGHGRNLFTHHNGSSPLTRGKR